MRGPTGDSSKSFLRPTSYYIFILSYFCIYFNSLKRVLFVIKDSPSILDLDKGFDIFFIYAPIICSLISAIKISTPLFVLTTL